MNELTTTEQNELEQLTYEQLNAAIGQDLQAAEQSFFDVGNKLRVMRKSEKYLDAYDTFDDFCQTEHGFSSRQAQRLMASAGVMRNLLVADRTHVSHEGILPENARQANELSAVAKDEQAEVWNAVVDTAPDGKVTGKHVKDVVNEWKRNGSYIPQYATPPPAALSMNSAHEWEANADVKEILSHLNEFLVWVRIQFGSAYDVGKLDDIAAKRFVSAKISTVIAALEKQLDQIEQDIENG